MIDLRRCPDCRGRISRSAAVCPHCGCDMVLHSQIEKEEEEAYCRKHGIKETEYLRHLFENEYGFKWNSTTDAMKHGKSYVSKDPTSQAYHKKMQAQKNKEKQKERKAKEIAEMKAKEIAEMKAKEIAEMKEKGKKALLKRIEKENAKRAAKEKKDAAEQKQEQVQKANEKQERVKQRRLLIKNGEPEIDYNKFIDMKKSEKQWLIIFVCSIGSFFILPWLISVSGICFSMFMYNKKVLKRLKEVFGQEISEKYNNNFQKLYTEYKDDINNLTEK